MVDHPRPFERPEIPVRSLLMAFGALAVPALTTLLAPSGWTEFDAMLWFFGLIPAFLLAFYRGWRGVAWAMVAGMAVLVAAQAAVLLLGRPIHQRPLLLAVITAYVGIGLGVGVLSELIHRERERAEAAALTDPLTGAPNRRYADLVLSREFSAAGRGRELAVVLFDLDHFKRYNDRHGHVAGDRALRTFSDVLIGTTRRMNLSARYGGEEFLSILSSTDAAGARVFTQRVQSMLAERPPEAGAVTVCAGIAQYEPGMKSPESLLALADEALYRAKAAGPGSVRTGGEGGDVESSSSGATRTA